MKSKFHRAVVVLSAAAAMFVGTDPPASADVGDPGWYVGLRALPAFSQAEDEACTSTADEMSAAAERARLAVLRLCATVRRGTP